MLEGPGTGVVLSSVFFFLMFSLSAAQFSTAAPDLFSVDKQ